MMFEIQMDKASNLPMNPVNIAIGICYLDIL